jgi:hypothetical protein
VTPDSFLRGIASPIAPGDEGRAYAAPASRWIERAAWLAVLVISIVGAWVWATQRGTSPTGTAMPATPAVRQIVATQVSTYGGAAWSAQDVIVFPSTTSGLSRVSTQGGKVSALTSGEGSHFWPQFLPDGEHFVYAAALPAARIVLGSLGPQPHRTLMTFPVRVSALAYASGHVLYVQDGSLFARPFDERALTFSRAGMLVYWPYPLETPATLQWLDRDGRSSSAVDRPARYVGFTLSPDARRLVFARMDASGGADLWLRDLDRQTEQQLTFDRAAYTPQWSPDGARILFSGPGQHPPPKLFVRGVAESAPISRAGADTVLPNFASSWSGDGSSIVSVRIDPKNGNDLWAQQLGTATETRLSINTEFNESHGKVSRNGQWLAYVTDESGRNEVWLARFPSGENRRQVSIAGGTSPQWAGDGDELFYISADKQLMSTPISTRHARLDVGAPRALFPLRNLIEEGRLLVPTANNYVVTPDGRRFLAAVIA